MPTASRTSSRYRRANSRQIPPFEEVRGSIRSLLQQASQQDKLGNAREAETYLFEAKVIARASRYREIQSEVEHSLSLHFGYYRQFEREVQHSKRAVQLLGPASDPLKKAIARTTFASALLYLEQYGEAHHQLSKALDYFYAKGISLDRRDAPYFETTLYHMGLLYHIIENWEAALNYLQHASEVQVQFKLQVDANVIGLIGAVHAELKNFDQARAHFEKQLVLAHTTNDLRAEAMAKSGLATVHEGTGELEAAIVQNSLALGIAIRISDPLRLAEIHANLASCYLQRNEVDLADRELERAFYHAENSGCARLHGRIHLLYSTCLEQQNNFRAALEHYKQYVEFKERLSGRAHQQLVSRLEARFRQKWLWHNQTIFLERIRLLERKITTQDQQHLDSPASISDTFKKALIARAATLTITELEVCQLLRSGCRTKEAAAQLGVSRHTIDGHRTAIRKKLSLRASQNLVSYLMSI